MYDKLLLHKFQEKKIWTWTGTRTRTSRSLVWRSAIELSWLLFQFIFKLFSWNVCQLLLPSKLMVGWLTCLISVDIDGFSVTFYTWLQRWQNISEINIKNNCNGNWFNTEMENIGNLKKFQNTKTKNHTMKLLNGLNTCWRRTVIYQYRKCKSVM